MARPEEDPTPEPEPETKNPGPGADGPAPASGPSFGPANDSTFGSPAEGSDTPYSSEHPQPSGPTGGGDETPPAPARHRVDLDRISKKVLLWAGVFVAVLTLYYVLASFLPRWWAERIVDLVGGSSGLGMWWGLFFGAVFTAIPIVVAWLAFPRTKTWKARLIIVGVAGLLATPNLLTLGIQWGSHDAAMDGQRLLDMDGPSFRGASLAGTIIGAVVTITLIALLHSYRGRGKRLKQLQHAADDSDHADPSD